MDISYPATQPHAQIKRQPDGSVHAETPHWQLLILPEGREAKAFNRNGLKKHLNSGHTEHIRWLVAELDDVRVYVKDNKIIMTKADLYP